MEFDYVFTWRNGPFGMKKNEKRESLCGKRFRVICRMVKNSVLVEFENGQQEVISRWAMRRIKARECFLT